MGKQKVSVLRGILFTDAHIDDRGRFVEDACHDGPRRSSDEHRDRGSAKRAPDGRNPTATGCRITGSGRGAVVPSGGGVVIALDGWLADPGWPCVRERAAIGVLPRALDTIGLAYRSREPRRLTLVEAPCGGRRATRLVGLGRPMLALMLAASAQDLWESRQVTLCAFGGDLGAPSRQPVVWPADDLEQFMPALLAPPKASAGEALPANRRARINSLGSPVTRTGHP